MHPLTPEVSCLLCFCLWIAIYFAASLRDDVQKETLLDGRFESKGSKAPFRHVADDDCIVFQTLENPRQPIFGIQATTKRKSERRTTEQKKKRIKLGENRPKQGKKQAGQAVESPGEKKDPSKEQDTLLSKEIKTYRQLIMRYF